jgi:hypothetical protein
MNCQVKKEVNSKGEEGLTNWTSRTNLDSVYKKCSDV